MTKLKWLLIKEEIAGRDFIGSTAQHTQKNNYFIE
jgi:hypothetical protein